MEGGGHALNVGLGGTALQPVREDRQALVFFLCGPVEVEEITIYSLARAADILADPTKYDPRSKETADHSLPYVIAAAIAERQVTPVQLTDSKIMDPVIRAQLNKVKVIADPEIEAVFPALQRVRVVLRTTDGREFTRELDYPKGDPRNPLSDDEIAGKFAALAEGIASPGDVERMRAAINRTEEYDSVRELMSELVAKNTASK